MIDGHPGYELDFIPFDGGQGIRGLEGLEAQFAELVDKQ